MNHRRFARKLWKWGSKMLASVVGCGEKGVGSWKSSKFMMDYKTYSIDILSFILNLYIFFGHFITLTNFNNIVLSYWGHFGA